MTKEQKKRLINDLCCRLPYQPIAYFYLEFNMDGVKEDGYCRIRSVNIERETVDTDCGEFSLDDIKLCLRRQSQMTDEECEEYENVIEYQSNYDKYDWFAEHHFDFRMLIDDNIAIEADDVIRDELGLTSKPAEDPYKTPVHIEMLDKDGMVVSENDYIGIMLPSDNPNEINLSLKPIE